MKKHLPLYLLLSANISCFAMEKSPRTSPQVDKLVQMVGEATIEDANDSDDEYQEERDPQSNWSLPSPHGFEARDPQEKSSSADEERTRFRVFTIPRHDARAQMPGMREQSEIEVLDKLLRGVQEQKANITLQDIKVAKLAKQHKESIKDRELRKQELEFKKFKFAYAAVNGVYTNDEVETMKPVQDHLTQYLLKKAPNVFPIEESLPRRGSFGDILSFLAGQ